MKAVEFSLIKGLIAGQQDAFVHLYDHYSPMLYGIILRIVPESDEAENLLQDCFVKIFKHINSFDPERGSFSTWLINIARNTALDYRRSSHFKHKLQNQNTDHLVSQEREPVWSSHNPETIGLKELVGQLSPEQRQIIDLLYFEGYTQQEVSDQFSIPLGTVKTRTRSALAALRALFQYHESSL